MRSHRIQLPVRGRPGQRAVLRLGERSLDPAVWLDACCDAHAPESGVRRELDGHVVAMKRGPIARSGGRRFRLRQLITGRLAPAEAEFEHLRWLRDRLFEAPEPLVAVTVLRRGVPVQQLFASLWIPGAVPFDAAWRAADAAERRALASEFGRELGRMHALRFLHGDVYPRNVLVRTATFDPAASPVAARRLVWIDAWAGGPSAWPRGSGRPPEYDLGAWLSEAVEWMARDDQRTMLLSYLEGRASNGRPVGDLDGFVARVSSARRAQLARLERARARLRGRPFPTAGWCPPPLRVEDGARP